VQGELCEQEPLLAACVVLCVAFLAPICDLALPCSALLGKCVLMFRFACLQLYAFLVRRTDSKFNKVVLKRLRMSKTNRPPMGLARVARYMAGKEGKTAVIVGSVTDDIRLEGHKFPALKIVALRVTESARARITAAGGEIMTFDQLAMQSPTGSNTVLLRGRRTARVANRYFGTISQDNARPRVRSKGRKFEKARGRRRSRGFKI